MQKAKTVRIAGASGFWGDAALATGQLLDGNDIDFIVYDYLAEITMAIMARVRAKDPQQGYATDFITGAMTPNLAEIAKQNIRIVSNAGGVNPIACANALRNEIEKQGLDLSVAVVTGDDLLSRCGEFRDIRPKDMFSGVEFPECDKIGSINAYLGAFPIAEALDSGADIVITGRCVDSAVTLGACIHAFGWQADEYDQLASGSLAGHILECGTQATGGNFTDWEKIEGGFSNLGYPIAEVSPNGSFVLTKAQGSGGLVSPGTVCEQMLYEIGDPQAYLLPDVTCDFSQTRIVEKAKDEVWVSGASGLPPSQYLKTCLTWHDGFRGGHLFGYYGIDAERKAQAFADAVFDRCNEIFRLKNMAPFSETSVELIGAEAQFGEQRSQGATRELAVKIAAKHTDTAGITALLKEATGLALSLPPGLCGFAGARPKPTPVMKLFSFLVPKADVKAEVHLANGTVTNVPFMVSSLEGSEVMRPALPVAPTSEDKMAKVPVIRLAMGRSGDKGDIANVGLVARQPEFLPWIWKRIDDAHLRDVFGHFIDGQSSTDGGRIERFLLPGTSSMNIVLHDILGGGGTSSLRNDPQGKGYAQLLLASTIEVPARLIGET